MKKIVEKQDVYSTAIIHIIVTHHLPLIPRPHKVKVADVARQKVRQAPLHQRQQQLRLLKRRLQTPSHLAGEVLLLLTDADVDAAVGEHRELRLR